MANDITKMTPEQIAEEATTMLNERHIQNHNFFARGTTIVDQTVGEQFTSHYRIERHLNVHNNYVRHLQNNQNIHITNLTDVVNVIQNSL